MSDTQAKHYFESKYVAFLSKIPEYSLKVKTLPIGEKYQTVFGEDFKTYTPQEEQVMDIFNLLGMTQTEELKGTSVCNEIFYNTFESFERDSLWIWILSAIMVIAPVMVKAIWTENPFKSFGDLAFEILLIFLKW